METSRRREAFLGDAVRHLFSNELGSRGQKRRRSFSKSQSDVVRRRDSTRRPRKRYFFVLSILQAMAHSECMVEASAGNSGPAKPQQWNRSELMKEVPRVVRPPVWPGESDDDSEDASSDDESEHESWMSMPEDGRRDNKSNKGSLASDHKQNSNVAPTSNERPSQSPAG